MYEFVRTYEFTRTYEFVRTFEYVQTYVLNFVTFHLPYVRSGIHSEVTSTECKTLKGERRMIFIFNIITALNYNQDRGIFCPCGKDALSLPVLIIK